MWVPQVLAYEIRVGAATYSAILLAILDKKYRWKAASSFYLDSTVSTIRVGLCTIRKRSKWADLKKMAGPPLPPSRVAADPPPTSKVAVCAYVSESACNLPPRRRISLIRHLRKLCKWAMIGGGVQTRVPQMGKCRGTLHISPKTVQPSRELARVQWKNNNSC